MRIKMWHIVVTLSKNHISETSSKQALLSFALVRRKSDDYWPDDNMYTSVFAVIRPPKLM